MKKNLVIHKVKACINNTLEEIESNNKTSKEIGDIVNICHWGMVLINDIKYTCKELNVMDSKFIITKIISKGSNYNELNYDVELYSKMFNCSALSRYEWIKVINY